MLTQVTKGKGSPMKKSFIHLNDHASLKKPLHSSKICIVFFDPQNNLITVSSCTIRKIRYNFSINNHTEYPFPLQSREVEAY